MHFGVKEFKLSLLFQKLSVSVKITLLEKRAVVVDWQTFTLPCVVKSEVRREGGFGATAVNQWMFPKSTLKFVKITQEKL